MVGLMCLNSCLNLVTNVFISGKEVTILEARIICLSLYKQDYQLLKKLQIHFCNILEGVEDGTKKKNEKSVTFGEIQLWIQIFFQFAS